MSLDAFFLRAMMPELASGLVGAKIEKIQQPARSTLVLTVKGQRRWDLLIGGSSGAPRIHFTNSDLEKPREPPMFCMLLRKHLIGARILEVTQPGVDRVVLMRLAAPGVFGEGEERGLAVELMGRAANVILTDSEGVITDCLYRTGSVEDKRALQPGMRYRLPPLQDKRDLLAMSDEDIRALASGFEGDRPLDRCVLSSLLGISPLIAREVCERAYGDTSPRVFEARGRDGLETLVRRLAELRDGRLCGEGEAYLISDPQGRPMDYTYIPVTQYGPEYQVARQESFCALLDGFYSRVDADERRRQRSRELTKTVKNARDRVARRLEAQRRELADTDKRDWYRECGDIITANIYAMKKGDRELVAEDFYSQSGGVRAIPLDPMKTPQQNAAKYYKEYSRAKSARAHLTEKTAEGRQELEYLESVLEELDRCETERDLAEIRQELIGGGYVRAAPGRAQPKRQMSEPMRFRSSSGLIIRVGRNNTQNDALTLKGSAKSDLWLHASKIHGSHVVISCGGARPDDEAVAQAASLAAYYSQARNAGKVPVDVTEVRNIKKPSGGRPGMVIYHTYRTIAAAPDEALANRLRIK